MSRGNVNQDAEAALANQHNTLSGKHLLLVFVISNPYLISNMDQNGLSTDLPAIATELNAKDTISWEGTASLNGNICFQMLYGRLSDIFGRKCVFIGAIVWRTYCVALASTH